MFFRKKSETEWQPEPISKITRRDRKTLKNWRIKRKARRDAQENLPEDSGTTNPKYSSTESNIRSFANGRYEELCQTYENSRQNLVLSIDNQYSIDILAPNHESNFIENVQGEIKTKFAKETVNLHELARDELLFEKDLKVFKGDNNLHSKASAKPSKDIIFIFILILIPVMIETLINMTAFQDVAGGLRDGIYIALVFSLVNISIGLIKGFSWRMIKHVWWFSKASGIFFAILMFFLACAFNLYIAHYRNFTSDTTINIYTIDVGFRVWESLLNSTFTAIGDLTDILLLSVGMLIFLAITIEMYCVFTDPYIGYSKAQSKADNAKKAWRKGKLRAVDSITNIVKKHKDDWDGQVQDGKQKIERVQEAGGTLVSHRSDIMRNIETMKNDANRALQVYREENMYVNPVKPAHFDILIEFSAMKPPTEKKKLADTKFLPTKIVKEELDKLKNNLAKNQDIFENMKRRVNEIQTKFLDNTKKEFDAIYDEERRIVLNIQNGTRQKTVKNTATE